MFDHWTLENGLHVVGERLPYLRSVSIGVWMRVGSMMETPAENGLSHFLEHMVFKGTEKRSTRDIAEEMDAVGGQMNAFTGKDCTCFYAKVIDEDLPLAVDILSDMTLHASLDEAEFKKERGVILEEISMEEDSPEDVVHELLSRIQFGNQAAGMPILGPAEQIAAYTRDDLANYRARHYHPENCVVALAGNYDPEQVLALIQQYFGEWKKSGQRQTVPPMQPIPGQKAAKEKDTEQLHICLGYPGTFLGSDELYPMSVMNNLLGGAMSSRLFQKIREEMGMAYSIYTYPSTYVGCGTFAVYAGVSPKNGHAVLDETLRQLDLLCRDGVTEKEFREAKNQLRGSYLLGLESPGSRMQSMGRGQLHLDRCRTPEETVAKIEAVTIESVNAVARRIFSNAPCISVVGKQAETYIKE
mgnify:FL=1